MPIMPEHVYKDVSDPANFKDAAALTGTGPFKLVNYDKTQGTYLYEANEELLPGRASRQADQVRQGQPGDVCRRPEEGRC